MQKKENRQAAKVAEDQGIKDQRIKIQIFYLALSASWRFALRFRAPVYAEVFARSVSRTTAGAMPSRIGGPVVPSPGCT